MYVAHGSSPIPFACYQFLFCISFYALYLFLNLSDSVSLKSMFSLEQLLLIWLVERSLPMFIQE